MKKFLIIFGTFVLFIITAGTIFKLMHWPGAGFLLVIGMTLFAGFYLPLFFIERMISNKTTLSIATNIFGAISTSALFLGVLFKVMHWPGAGLMIVVGGLFFMFPTLILYAIQQFKEYDKKFSEFWRTVVLGVMASVFLMYWGLNLSRNVLVAFLQVEDANIETNKNMMECNSYMLQTIETKLASGSPGLITAMNIHKKTEETNLYIENIKAELILNYMHEPNEALDNHWFISQKDNYDIPTFQLGTPYSEQGKTLFTTLINHKSFLREELEKSALGSNTEIDGMGDFGISTELNQELFFNQGYQMEWNEGMFKNQTVAATLALLTGIQNQLLNAEFKSLRYILGNSNSTEME